MVKLVRSPNFVYRFYRGSRNDHEAMAYISANQIVMRGCDADLVALIALRTLLGTRARFRTRSAGLVKAAGVNEMVVVWEQEVTLLLRKVDGLQEELQHMGLELRKARPSTCFGALIPMMLAATQAS